MCPIPMQSYTYIVNVSKDINTYCIVLAAGRKVTDLETKMERMAEEKTDQNHGK